VSPHWLFVTILILSVSAAMLSAIASGNVKEVIDMALIVGIASSCVGATLLITRKYWQGARWVN